MRLPFSVEQFFDVFREYNEAVWPVQLLLLALAIGVVVLPMTRIRQADVLISAALAFLWLWVGLAYHFSFFTAINPLAYAFAAVSVAGAGVFAWQGIVRGNMRFRYQRGWRSAAGIGLIAFALIVYPTWAWLAGHYYPAVPTFGLPCPTTIFTIGMLGLLVAPYPRSVLIVPVLWSFVGGQAALLLNVPQDLGLIVAGIAGIAMLARWRASSPPVVPSGH